MLYSEHFFFFSTRNTTSNLYFKTGFCSAFKTTEDDSETVGGGHALTCKLEDDMSSKGIRGLGITNLDCFGRALRLHWLWLQWNDPDRPWAGSQLPCDVSDMALFRVSTVITIHDGQKVAF